MIEYKSYLQLRLICDMLETYTLAELWIAAMLPPWRIFVDIICKSEIDYLPKSVDIIIKYA